MVDPILNARLDVLEQELTLTNARESWLQKLCSTLNRYESKDLKQEWYKFASLLGVDLEDQGKILQKIRERLKAIELQDDQAARDIMSQAWADYTKALDRSQMLFREFLEYIGGLIFRDKEFDQEICDLADELIRFCAQLVSLVGSMSVPAARDSLTRSVGWMVRVRFPEWTIWTLPFAAHEYGHVVLKEFSRLDKIIREEVDKWLETDPEFQALPADKQDIEKNDGPLQQRATSYVKEFLADAFATYLMGPAYAFPAILLRFDPTGSSALSRGLPLDTHRAYIVLEILKGMNSAITQPYQWVIDYLTTKWEETQKRVNATPLTAPEKARLDAVIEGWRRFPSMFLPEAGYQHSGNEGWAIAGGWAQLWSEQARNMVPLQLPPGIDHSSRLRDVLNAAWICRIKGDVSDVAEIEKIAKVLINEIRLKIAKQVEDTQRKIVKRIARPRRS